MMPDAREAVILVHGLWMIGLEFGVLRHHLQANHGFDVHVFTYSSMHGDTAGIASELADFTRRKAGGTGEVQAWLVSSTVVRSSTGSFHDDDPSPPSQP